VAQGSYIWYVFADYQRNDPSRYYSTHPRINNRKVYVGPQALFVTKLTVFPSVAGLFIGQQEIGQRSDRLYSSTPPADKTGPSRWT